MAIEKKQYKPEIITGTDGNGNQFGMVQVRAYPNKFRDGSYNCSVELPADKPDHFYKVYFECVGVPPQFVKLYKVKKGDENGIPQKA